MNTAIDEKRSSTCVIPGGRPGVEDSQGRVGGRQEEPPPPGGGGGSLNVYTTPEPSFRAEKKIGGDPLLADPRFAVLRKIGMHPRWITLAQRIGMDAFLEMWRAVDEDETRTGTSILISIPRLSRFTRFQRNHFILTLAREGFDTKSIRHQVWHELREDISLRHISRLIEKRENRG